MTLTPSHKRSHPLRRMRRRLCSPSAMALSGLMSRSSARSARFASSLVRASPPLRPATVVAAMMPRRSLSSLTSEDVERLGAKGLNDPKLKELFEGMCVPGETSIPTDALAKRLAGSDGSSFYTNAGALVELLMTWTAKKMDTNSDGVVSFDEFKSAVRQTEADLLETSFFSTKALEMLGIDSFDEDALRAAFDASDSDRSGGLDPSEVRALLLKVSPQLADSPALETMLTRVMERLDTDPSDGVITFNEFKATFALYQHDLGWWKDGAVLGVWKPF